MKVKLVSLLMLAATQASAAKHTVWQICNNDNSVAGMALASEGYKQFLANDFGYEDRYFLFG